MSKLEPAILRRALLSATIALALPACSSLNSAAGDEPFLKSEAAENLPDFSYAGYEFGLSPLPTVTGTVLKVSDFGAVPDDADDDSKAVLAALDAAHQTDGPVIVELPAGRLILSAILPIERSNIVLRGAGSGPHGTELHFPRPLASIDKSQRLQELRDYLLKYDKKQKEPNRNIDELFSEYSWTGGFLWIQKPGTRAASYLEEFDPPIERLASALSGQRGQRSVRVDTAETLAVGDAVQLQWFNRDGESGALLREIYGNTNLAMGSHHWTFPDRPLVRQTTRITAIKGNTVEIGDPLLHSINDAVPAQFSAWEHLEQVGLEDFAITFPDSPYFGHHLERGYNGIYLTSVIDGWIRDVRFENADSGVLTYNSANVTIEQIQSLGKRPAHYAVHLGNVHNVLVRDLVIENPVIHSLTFNTQATKSVYQRATVYSASVLDQHAGSNHQNLFDDITLHIEARPKNGLPAYPIWNGSGAGYWQPGHGSFNTTWNLNVIVDSGALRDEPVVLEGLEEGPDAYILGVHGNRDFTVDYRPAPRRLIVDRAMDVPSLYDWQLQRRKANTR